MTIRQETEDEYWARARALNAHLIKRGLQSGLSRFFERATRVALIYSFEQAETDDFLVYDSTNLLDEHKDALQAYFATPSSVPRKRKIDSPRESIDSAPSIADKLLCFTAQTDKVFFLMVCVENHHFDGANAIVDKWVNFAQIYFQDPKELPVHFAGTAERVLEHSAFDVVREVIMSKMFHRKQPGGQADAETMLNALLEIATTKEEGIGCTGQLCIFDRNPEIQPMVDLTFDEPIALSKHKHVRKLLTSTSLEYRLVSRGSNVVGISAAESVMNCLLKAEFDNGHALLSLKGKPLCRLINGHFRAGNQAWSLREIRLPKLLAGMSDEKRGGVQKLLDQIVQSARRNHCGCTVIFDFGDADNRKLSGHRLKPALKIVEKNFQLLRDMCKVDGAVHIDANKLEVLAFACLLDGEAVEKENLARGARYNSARRYSNKIHDVVILVVSEDGPVTLFEAGEATAAIEKSIKDYEAYSFPPTFKGWLEGDRPTNEFRERKK